MMIPADPTDDAPRPDSSAADAGCDESGCHTRLAELRALAAGVLESDAAADAFLDAPHPLFDHALPRVLANTADGARRVERVLLRLEHSLPV